MIHLATISTRRLFILFAFVYNFCATQGYSQCNVIPSNLNAYSAGGNAMSLTWGGVSNATGYYLQIENANNNPTYYNTEFQVGAATSHTASVPASGSYKFKVRTVCGGDKSNWSYEYFFNAGTTGGGSGTGGTCTIPSGLTATTAGGNSMTVSWTAVAGVSGYTLQVENGSGNNTYYHTEFPISSNSFTIGLPSAGSFKYKVRSLCGGNNGDWSPFYNFNTGTTGGGTGGGTVGGGTGGCATIPSGLTATTAGGNSMTVSWTAVAGVSGYTLQVENGSGNNTYYHTEFPISSNSFTIGLPSAGSFKFKVRSLCGGNNGDWSAFYNFNTGTTGGGTGGGTAGFCSIPSGLSASSAGGHSMTVSWSPVAGVSGYTIQVENASGNNSYLNVEFPVSSNSFTIGLPSAGNYKYKVRSRCGGSNGDWSAFYNFTAGLLGTGTRQLEEETDPNSITDFSIYPQPAGEEATIDLSPMKDKEVEIVLLNSYGRIVKRIDLGTIVEPLVKIDLSQISNGYYLMQINAKGQRSKVKKLVVARMY
jgi:hypothetical protein